MSPRGSGNNAIHKKPVDDKNISKEEWQRRHTERYDPLSRTLFVNGLTGHGVMGAS